MSSGPFRFVFDLLFPLSCAGCGAEGTVLCASCERRIVIRRVPHHPPHVAGLSAVYAATEYRDPLVASLVARLKYDGVREAAPILGAWCLRHLVYAGFAATATMLAVPVPLSKERLARRGFNQAELIAERVARDLGIPVVPQALVRTRNTAPQTAVALRIERVENVKGAFAVKDPSLVRGKIVLVVDDVTTTGATLSECARALKKAGAKEVIALAAAC
ncbi:MAG: ComF family protein [Patescibacteria group bacterium]